jgi:prolipoprotein diacylglyceryltransferase
MFFSGPHPVFPTQLFEALAALVAALIAIRLTRRQCTPGVAFLVAAIWLTAWQFGIQHLRLIYPEHGNFASIQRLSPLVLCLFALVALARLPRRKKGTQEPREAVC